MAKWNNWIVTNAGREILLSGLASTENVLITKLKLSSHDYRGRDLTLLDDLTDVQQDFSVSKLEVVNQTMLRATIYISNVNLTKEYQAWTRGIFGRTTRDTKDKLLMVQTNEEATTMQVMTDGHVTSSLLTVNIGVSNTEKVSVRVDLDLYVMRKDVYNLIYPVGSIYLSDGTVDPNKVFSGTWKKLEGKYIRASGTYNGATTKAMGTGGEETHALTIGEMPAHNHNRGNMEISGSFAADDSMTVDVHNTGTRPWGAFYSGHSVNYDMGSEGGGGGHTLEFRASRMWTGTTNTVGGSNAVPVKPAYIALDVWQRTA